MTNPAPIKSRLTTRLFVLVLSSVLAVGLGVFACKDSPPGVQPISAEALLSEPPTGALVLDVRSEEEFSASHVPGALNIPHDEIGDRLSEMGAAKSAPIVVYCQRGGRAGKAAETLLDAGYTNVLHLEGDMEGWLASGHPTASGSAGS
jgi:rhodanese-related sulfurtransferase